MDEPRNEPPSQRLAVAWGDGKVGQRVVSTAEEAAADAGALRVDPVRLVWLRENGYFAEATTGTPTPKRGKAERTPVAAAELHGPEVAVFTDAPNDLAREDP